MSESEAVPGDSHWESGHDHRYSPVATIDRSRWRRWVAWLPAFGGSLAFLAFLAAVVAVLVLAVVVLPDALIHDDTLSAGKRLDAVGALRSSLIQAAVGTALLVGLYFTARTAGLARQGQIADRFSKAVEQLGSESLNVRIGAIYALEHIARDSRRLRPAILAVLEQFLAGECSETDSPPPRLPRDAQVAMNVLARRRGATRERERLDLLGLCLPRLRLNGGNLRDVSLFYAHLSGAALVACDLRDIGLGWSRFDRGFLSRSDLRGADMRYVDLRGTFLPGADLRGADLNHADLRRTDFSYRTSRPGHVYLRAARLKRVNFHHARTDGADFRGADLRHTKGLVQSQIDHALTDANTRLPKGLVRPTHEHVD